MIAINNEIKIFFDALKEARETARKERDTLKVYNQLVKEPINYNLLKEFCKLQTNEKLIIEIINTSGSKITIRREEESGLKPILR